MENNNSNKVNLPSAYIGLYEDKTNSHAPQYILLTCVDDYHKVAINKLLKEKFNTDKIYECYSPVDKQNTILINDLDIDIFSSKLYNSKMFLEFINDNYDVIGPLISSLKPEITIENALELMEQINNCLAQAQGQRYVDELNAKLAEYNSDQIME